MIQDPVCGMEVKVKDENLSVVFNKKTYYFCSDLCKLQFLQKPEKYIKKENEDEHNSQN